MSSLVKVVSSALVLLVLAACGRDQEGGSKGRAETLVIATVNNADMIRMQKLSPDFMAKHPGIKLEWVILEENTLRQRVTTDIATGGGQFDVLTIGIYEIPIWAAQNWLKPLQFESGYGLDDLLPSVREAASANGTLYGAPFYGEGSMLMYRTDLFAKANLVMPRQPSWAFVIEAAKRLNDPENGVYGICLRGKAGWGENMALITAMGNAFGARWFDENWKAQFDQPHWKDALQAYVDVMRQAGPPGASSNGFNENLALFNSGRCAIWLDATVAASFVSNPKESQVAENVGFSSAPEAGRGKTSGWLWAWNLAIPASSRKADKAQAFIAWATSRDYIDLVAAKEGWANVPPGTRSSLYRNANYLKAAPFATQTLKAIESADIHKPTELPVPYTGIQYVAIPQFQSIGMSVGQQFSAALSGSISVDDALRNAQAITEREMSRAGQAQ
jgi:sorbitol/mannitol transport system substrate-binding protein